MEEASPIFIQVTSEQLSLINGGLAKQIEVLKSELKNSNLRNTKLEHMLANKGIELENVKEENLRLIGQLNGKPISENFVVTGSRFHFISSSNQHPPHDWMVSFWTYLNNLASKKDIQDKWLIQTSTDVGLVYRIIKEDPKMPYHYCGTRGEFVEEWNDNVANRQEPYRREKLTCKERSLNSAISKSPIKDTDIKSWDNLYLSGEQDCDKYCLGYEIKKEIERFRFE